MSTSTFTVKGMTCGHCVNHVTKEVKKIAGVTAVDITLESGAVAITSDSGVSPADVEAAVVEAGYELVK
jgi:copper ion binding protein